MLVEPSKIKGAFLIRPEPIVDERGSFMRVFCVRELYNKTGHLFGCTQQNVSVTRKAFTLRGLHYQKPPYGEVKIVRCAHGVIHDIVVDLRKDSPSYKQYAIFYLSSADRNSLIVPQGCAHGFMSLTDDVEVSYMVSAYHRPESERGLRWSDPAFDIAWTQAPHVVSAKDNAWPDFDPDGYHSLDRDVP